MCIITRRALSVEHIHIYGATWPSGDHPWGGPPLYFPEGDRIAYLPTMLLTPSTMELFLDKKF